MEADWRKRLHQGCSILQPASSVFVRGKLEWCAKQWHRLCIQNAELIKLLTVRSAVIGKDKGLQRRKQ